jgi:hypothetical protein
MEIKTREASGDLEKEYSANPDVVWMRGRAGNNR